ncbi:MAG TPA: hypothetical protein VMI12_08590 [Puia sp.]|nr:hypothetical protein [Puia sp.]
MSSRLEQFIQDHREEFDGDEPSKKVWENISRQMDPDKNQETTVVRFNILRWSVAAAILILAGTGAWYFIHNTNTTTLQPVAVNTKPVTNDSTKPSVNIPVDSSSSQLVITNPENQKNLTGNEPANTDELNSYNEEMYHYTKLIEIKHNELKKIEKDEPLLYKKFAGDVYKLDSVYHSLQKQLPKNPNREQLLEAMIQNLQLQIGLLNHQLDIIKQINHSKKSEYEKAYKSV